MAVLVTRPAPDNARTAERLRVRGFATLLAPMLRFEPLPFRIDAAAKYSGIVVTSVNALRAITDHPLREQHRDTQVFAVGERTADAARALGFARVVSADGDIAALRKVIAGRAARGNARAPLLHLAGADITDDAAGGLESIGVTATRAVVYRMVAVDRIPPEVADAFAARQIDAVLHYSSRSALSFLAALRAAGLEVGGLAVLQCCLSDAVARALREAGAARVISAAKPDEATLIEALERSLR